MIFKNELNESAKQFKIYGSQIELMLKKNEQKAEELTMTWIDKWNNSTNNIDTIDNKNVIIIKVRF